MWFGAAAWACVPQPFISLRPGQLSAPGDKVTAAGFNFGDNSVELRWNAIDGPLLAKAPGPSFTTTMTIPKAADGIYTIIAVPRDPDGTVLNSVASAIIEVINGWPFALAPVPGRPGQASSHAAGGINTLSAVLGGAGVLAIGLFVGTVVAARRRPGPVVVGPGEYRTVGGEVGEASGPGLDSSPEVLRPTESDRSIDVGPGHGT
jgi:hypothetical protein